MSGISHHVNPAIGSWKRAAVKIEKNNAKGNLAGSSHYQEPTPNRLDWSGTSCQAEQVLFRNIVDAIADACKHSNGRFDRGRFEVAAGVGAIKVL